MAEEIVDRDLSGARFERVDLSGAQLRNVTLQGARIRGAWLEDVELDGMLRGSVVVNGVDVAAYVEAELDRRHPGRERMRPTDAEGFREAWGILERLWPETIAHARALPPERLHERVDDEWSFIETMRHLLMVVDAWVKRALLADPAPYHPLGLPHSEMEPDPVVPNDPDARPSLDEVLPAFEERLALVREHLARLTDEELDGEGPLLPAPGYPPAGSYPVRRCLGAVVSELWEHRLIAERDLAALEGSTPTSS